MVMNAKLVRRRIADYTDDVPSFSETHEKPAYYKDIVPRKVDAEKISGVIAHINLNDIVGSADGVILLKGEGNIPGVNVHGNGQMSGLSPAEILVIAEEISLRTGEKYALPSMQKIHEEFHRDGSSVSQCALDSNAWIYSGELLFFSGGRKIMQKPKLVKVGEELRYEGDVINIESELQAANGLYIDILLGHGLVRPVGQVKGYFSIGQGSDILYSYSLLADYKSEYGRDKEHMIGFCEHRGTDTSCRAAIMRCD